MDINQSSPFYKSFNPSTGLPRTCSSSTGQSAIRESNSIRRAQFATLWISADDREIGHHAANIESQFQTANAHVTGTSHSKRVRTIHYQFPHYYGSLTIGPYNSAPQSNCPSPQAIHVTANELFIP